MTLDMGVKHNFIHPFSVPASKDCFCKIWVFPVYTCCRVLFHLPLLKYYLSPRLSREHREGLAKSAKVFYNQAKDKLRKVHSKYVKKVNQPEVKAHHGKDLLRNISQWVSVSQYSR